MNKLKFILTICLSAFFYQAWSQQNDSELTIRKIMQGPEFVGTSPSDIRWSEDSQNILFHWNPEHNPGDSLYKVGIQTLTIEKVTPEIRRILPESEGTFNKDKSQKLYTKNGDLYLLDLNKGINRLLVNIADPINWADFSTDQKLIYFVAEDNAFSLNRENGQTLQLAQAKNGSAPTDNKSPKAKHKEWLEKDQLAHFEVLKERKEKQDAHTEWVKQNKQNEIPSLYKNGKNLYGIRVSPDGRYISYHLAKYVSTENTMVHDFVTESGYTNDLTARPKVGSPLTQYEAWILDVEKDTTYQIITKNIPGIKDLPEFMRKKEDTKKKKNRRKKHDEVPQADKDREVIIHGPYWSEEGKQSIIVVRALDNKDRWIMKLNLETGEPTLLDRQHDEAWVAGPGIEWYYTGGNIGWMPDQQNIWFMSEESGYSHLYTLDVNSGNKKALTQGEFEIYDPQLSSDDQNWYFHSNKEHPGERHFYTMPLKGGEMQRLTLLPGRNDVTLSPDEKHMAILHSESNKPWELYYKEKSASGNAKQITDSRTEEFKKYDWRTPEYITFEARDGEQVHARLYKPKNTQKAGPAVIFVHGAGYLQNAHKWWSTYYREYMFHNFLADNGYTVLDIDYRGSAGYGRDWRTGIYQHMGGKDLTDQVDGANYLVEKHGIDPERMGIYGGSYGGFITLMAMFTEPEVFQAGAALRSVTDWAHYNHGYTSNILNTPVTDSLAYAKSSPIYYAEGLQGALLICHGMVDRNVQFQDVVRLAQRLIELGKKDWELAVYPMEGHGFKEPSSWTDEYRRIYELFEENLK